MTMSSKKKTVLVVGDVALDRSWFVDPSPPDLTSQAHGSVWPERFIEKGDRNGTLVETDVLGGAATVARAIKAIRGFDISVSLVGAWGDDIGGDRLQKLMPEGLVECFCAAKTPYTSLKWRVYEQGSSGKDPRLVRRFDRDVPFDPETPYKHCKRLKFPWPDPSDVAVVAVVDYGKGLLGLPDVCKSLCMYKGLPFLLRTRGARGMHPLDELPWTILLQNRAELARVAGGFQAPPPPTLRKVAKHWEPAPALMKLLMKVPHAAERRRRRSVIVKLDREGALLLDESGQLHVIALERSCQGEWAGVSAGDVLMAHVAADLAQEKDLDASLVGACVRRATAFCRQAEKISHQDGPYKTCYARSLQVKEKDVEKVLLASDREGARSADEISAELSLRDDAEMACVTRIVTRHAEWYIEGFLTLDHEFGSGVMALRARFQQYGRAKDEHRRPFVVAVCGEPGTGKSTLARALAQEVREVEFIGANAAQWVSFNDLWGLCELIRSARIRGKLPVVFIDEVDSKVSGEHLYGKLLAPLWDGEYVLRGARRELGPSIFLLAGSGAEWSTAHKLALAAGGATDKLPDLVSRLSTDPIDIPKFSGPIVLYAAARFLQDRFPLLRKVDRGILRVLMKPATGARALRQAIGRLAPPADPTWFKLSDIPDEPGRRWTQKDREEVSLA